ncbi:hypothetical protein Tcan_07002 [Toxocara canis]|uniref:Uncharacterized protein n=1 Tax=Toxocara canis TaxID=6265 RepID=A0A0B2W0M4_TOXCA|nr:hypothetical protein Tcan_07002 [Toxocara canis]
MITLKLTVAEQNNEDQLDGKPLVVNVDQPIPGYNNTDNMFIRSHAMRQSIDEKTPRGSQFSEDQSVTQKLLYRNLPSIANDKTTENVWIQSIRLTQSTEPPPTSAQAMKNSLASPVTLSEDYPSMNNRDVPNVLMAVFNESETTSNRWSTPKQEMITARETATEKTIKHEVKVQNSSRSVDEAIGLLRALILRKLFSSPAFGNISSESATLAVPLELSTPTMNDDRFQTRVLSTQTQQTNFEGPLQPVFMNSPQTNLVNQMSGLYSNKDVMPMFRPVHLQDKSEARSAVMPIQANEAAFSNELQSPDSLFVSESSSAPKLYSWLPGPADQTAATETTGDRIQLESSTAGSTATAMIIREDEGVSANSMSDGASENAFLTDQPVLETERTGTTLPDPVDIAGWEHYAENHVLMPVGPVENSGNGSDALDVAEAEPFNNALDITAPEFLGG